MSTIQINIILIYDVNIRSEGIREIQRNYRGEGLFDFLYRARHYTWMLENMLEREKKNVGACAKWSNMDDNEKFALVICSL